MGVNLPLTLTDPLMIIDSIITP